MSCYHPLHAIPNGKTINGKTNYRFLSDLYLATHPELEKQCTLIPCGQCLGCRLDYSRQWADRCMLELQYHDSSYFVTLTYDEAHVPVEYYADKATGEAFPSLTLRKRDFQLFMKRLRKRFSDDHIRFFMAGEYGSETFRPHYHAILFGLHLNDLRPYKRSPQGYHYYNSDSLQSCWLDHDGNPIGFVVVGEVTWDTCAYTARYIMKKQKGAASRVYSDFALEPEFTLMSRKPGIARQYYDDHPDIYETQKINISTSKGGRQMRPPRYFDKLFDLEHPEEMAKIKAQRKDVASALQSLKLEQTSLSEHDFLEVQERSKEARIKSLRRNLV